MRKGIFIVGVTAATVMGGQNGSALTATEEDWIQRGSDAAVELATGNPQQAAQQMIPQKVWQPSPYTNVQVRPQGAAFQQRIGPVSPYNVQPSRLTGNYNAATTFRQNTYPAVTQQAQVQTATRYFNTSTVITPTLGNKSSSKPDQ